MADDVIAGRYRLRELLGFGPMSEVWAAEDGELERVVALKLLAPDADRARFEREARAAASLAHPHITQLFDYGEAAGRPYMVLEYLPGGTLEDLLRDGRPLPDAESRRIAAELAAGLAHAHGRGLVHRDLKPANILFDAEGRAKIADFGIARLGSSSGTLTEAGTVLGTAAYISPEQAMGELATPASDVYSFGVILYRMLSGRLPFEAAQPIELLRLHRDVPPPPLARVRVDAPADLAAVAAAALAKDPADRPADGSALLALLGETPRPPLVSAAAAGADTSGPTRVLAGAAPRPPPGRRKRFPLGAAAAAALLLAGGGALAYAVTRPGSASAPAPTLPTTVPHRTLPKLNTAAPTRAATSAAPPPTTAATTTRATTSGAATTTRKPGPTTTAQTPPPPPPTTTPATTEATTTQPPTTTATTGTVGTTGTTVGG